MNDANLDGSPSNEGNSNRRNGRLCGKQRFHVRKLPPTKSGEDRWEVSGVLNGEQIRERYRSHADALACAAKLNQIARGGPQFREAMTTLSDHVLRDAEASYLTLTRVYPEASLSLAVHFYLERYKPCGSQHTVLTAMEAFLADKPGLSKRQQITYSYVLRSFAKSVLKKLLHEIGHDDVASYLDASKTWSPGTWNRRLGDLKAFFNWCKEKKRSWIAENPCEQFEVKPTIKGEPEILALATCRDLMAHVDTYTSEPAVPFMFALCLFTGIRPDYRAGEFYELGRKIAEGKAANHFRMDKEQLFLSADMTKDGRVRFTRLHPGLIAWLKKYPPSPEMFDARVIDRHYTAIRKQFSIPHDGLRHTFISAFATLHGYEKAAIEAGNSVEMIKTHYYGHMTDDDAEAFWEIRPS